MFTDNQAAILRILAEDPNRELSVSELGRRLGKAPGVFQRGLNGLEENGYVRSRRQANLRLLRANTAHPLYGAARALAGRSAAPLPPDVSLTAASPVAPRSFRIAEPPGLYAAATRRILIIAGPNGAGKTTFARAFLPEEADCPIFVNADYIARGLSPFAPEWAAMKAGKLMLRELNDHVAHGRSVAVETTLSGRRYARLIPRWREGGYAVKLIFLSLPSVELALARVACRVRQGGHAIPETTVRRRFDAGWKNFEAVYKHLVDAWALYDNSGRQPFLVDQEEQ